MMASPIDVAHQLLKTHYDPDFGMKPGDFDPSESAYHDNAEEEAYSRHTDQLTLDELAFILPDDVWNRLEEQYEKENEDDWEHHQLLDYYDAHDASMANHIESYLDTEGERLSFLNPDGELPDYLLDWQAASDAKARNSDTPSWGENDFDINEFDRKNWEWDDESQNMVLRGEGEPIEMAFKIFKEGKAVAGQGGSPRCSWCGEVFCPGAVGPDYDLQCPDYLAGYGQSI